MFRASGFRGSYSPAPLLTLTPFLRAKHSKVVCPSGSGGGREGSAERTVHSPTLSPNYGEQRGLVLQNLTHAGCTYKFLLTSTAAHTHSFFAREALKGCLPFGLTPLP